MKRLLIALSLVTLLVLAAVLVAVPIAVPRIVERLVAQKAAEFGLRAQSSMKLGYCWRNGPGIEGSLTLIVADSPWRVNARFGASCSEYAAEVAVPLTAFSEGETVVRAMLARYPVNAFSNLTFNGTLSLTAKAERTFSRPMPVWSAKANIRELDAAFSVGGADYEVERLTLTPSVSGIADHVDIAPLSVWAHALNAGGFALTNFHASVRASERSLLVTELGAEVCGGQASVYSLYLDTKRLNAGFTMFLDDIEAGEALSRVKGFNGEASGRLHGKLGLRVMGGGKGIRLSDAFLYSTPGEVGKLKMVDPKSITENLAYAGLDDASRDNVAKALADLDYSALRLNLRRGEGRAATLSFAVAGHATRDRTTVPVDLAVNINGELEQLINSGLGLTLNLKGKGKRK